MSEEHGAQVGDREEDNMARNVEGGEGWMRRAGKGKEKDMVTAAVKPSPTPPYSSGASMPCRNP